VIRSIVPKPDRPEEELAIGVLRVACVLLARVYHHLDVQAPCRLPRTGAGILVCNHTSGLDPVLIQSVCPRVIVWMMAEEYGRIPALRPVFKANRAIMVSRQGRGRDLAAVREGMRALEAGMILGVFPEGRIEPTDDLLPFHTGVTMIARKYDVPIYPAYLDGTQRRMEMPDVFVHRQRATLRFGAPFHLPPATDSDDSLNTGTAQIRSAVTHLKRLTAEQKRRNYD
jgi:1-acyl-sn-glycerol-3-phosphate acyltransferase